MRKTRTWSIAVLALGGLLLAPRGAAGQDRIRRVSLAEAMDAFARNSLALGMARSEAAGLAGAARQSRAYFNPAFSFARDDLSHGGRSVREETFRILQRLELPARTAARSRAALHEIDAGAARLRADSTALAFEVREAYVRAWFAEEAEATVRRTASVVRSVAEDAEIRLDAGDIAAYEARRLRIERVAADLETEEAAQRARDARRTLAALIAPGEAIREIGPSRGLDGAPPVIARAAAMAALPLRPDVEAAARGLDAARAEADVARTYWAPQPTLGLGYRIHGDGFGGASVALDLPLPLFDRGAGSRERADGMSAAAAYRLDLARRLAEHDLLTAWDRHASGRTRLETAAPGLLADGEALLASAAAAYAENEIGLLELLDAAGAFRRTQLTALSLAAQAWTAYYDLLRAMDQAPEHER